MRMKHYVIALLTVPLVFSPSWSFAAKQKKGVAGRTSGVSDVVLQLNSDYCDTAWPYTYVDSGPNTTSASSTGTTAQKVDDTVVFPPGSPSRSNPLTITDPGGSILGQAEVELAPDGSDASRLLVRTLAGSPANTPCTGQKAEAPGGESSNHFSFANAAYYLIDVVRWEAVSGKSAATYQVASDNWYLFNLSDAKASHRKFPFTFRPFVTNDLRIFGDTRHPQKTNVVFLAISLAPQGGWEEWSNNVDVSYKLHADKVIPANIQDLQTLISFLAGQTSGEKAAPKVVPNTPPPPLASDFQGRYGAAVLTNLKDLPAKLTSTMTARFKGAPSKSASPYCAKVTKSLLTASGKVPDSCPSIPAESSMNAQNPKVSDVETGKRPVRVDEMREHHLLLTRYEFLPSNQLAESSSEAQETAPRQVALAGQTPIPAANGVTNSPPSSQTKTSANCDPSTANDPQAAANAQKPCTLTQTIQDEGLYHWDVSIAVPITGYRETVFDSNNNVMAKSVTRANAYAMLDIAPWREDFVKPPMFGIPHLMTGLPLASKVFNKPFVGGLGEDVGFSKLLPFSARIFAGVVYNKEFRGTDQMPHRVWKVQYGIELSMSSAISKLKGNTSTKANSTTTDKSN